MFYLFLGINFISFIKVKGILILYFKHKRVQKKKENINCNEIGRINIITILFTMSLTTT